jgi:C-terminal processing protease CtpA/Prc
MRLRALALLVLLLHPAELLAADDSVGAVALDHQFDSGSGINAVVVSRSQTDNLLLLGEVWGFLKYHHPKVTAGAISWDYELFRILPAVLDAKNVHQAQGVIAGWIDRLGIPAPCTSCASMPDSVQLKPHVGWIHDRRKLGADLSRQLETIYTNRPADGIQYFVTFTNWGSLDFSQERPYATQRYPDTGYRLLALFRVWNIIEYWSPYRDLIDENWEQVLAEFIPRVVAAANERDYVTTLLAFVARIDDGHATIQSAWKMRPPGGECGLPVRVRNLDGQMVVYEFPDSTLAKTSGLLIGDVLTSIDHEPVGKLVKRIYPYYSGSNEVARQRTIAFNMSNGPCGSFTVEVKRDGNPVTVESRREEFSEAVKARSGAHDLRGPAFQKISDEVAYLKLSAVKQSLCSSYIEQAAGTRCLIIDIRNYPAEFVPYALGGHLVDKPTEFLRPTRATPSNPGVFVWKQTLLVQPLVPRYKGKVGVLVDDASISQSEFTAMAFRAAGALIIGSQTAGADGDTGRVPLPGGLNMGMSTVGMFYPDGKPTQRIGIIPDFVVHPTISGIRDGHDEVAEAAVKHLIGVDLRIPLR